MTILIIRALREYLFMSSLWRKFSPDLRRYEGISDQAEEALGKVLWDSRSRYLINFNGSQKVSHFYMGSLLAPVFHVLSTDQSQQLVQTAERELVAPGIGVRAVMPPDFHTDSVRAFFHFAGNEAGDPCLYFNGGVWHHNNAWYVLALRAIGRVNDAFGFFRPTMTLDGISRSPRGQPAMYEYRFSDPASPEYGRIDKPSYLWGAGFTLYAAYRLIGIDENEWNISFSEEFPKSLDSATCSLEFLGEKRIIRKERGNGALIFVADRDTIPSLVIPLDLASTSSWVLQRGHSTVPTLTKINAILQSARFKSKTRELKFLTSSFSGHTVSATVVAPTRPHAVTVDGKSTKEFRLHAAKDGRVEITLRFAGSNLKQSVILKF